MPTVRKINNMKITNLPLPGGGADYLIEKGSASVTLDRDEMSYLFKIGLSSIITMDNEFKCQHGALTCTKPIPGVTQKLVKKENIDFYGNPYFICETIYESAAKVVAELLGVNRYPSQLSRFLQLPNIQRSGRALQNTSSKFWRSS